MNWAFTTSTWSIAHQAIEAARIKYAVGKVPQQDILKAQVALTRLAEHMIRFDRDAEWRAPA